MNDLGWTVPTSRVDAGSARQAILWQHDCIRHLLAKASAVAELALDSEAPPTDAVASVIVDLRATIEVHLTFEEIVLLPLLRADPTAGPGRQEQRIDEHRRQRAVLAAIEREATAHPHLPTLAAKLAFLTSWLRADMDEEERCLVAQRSPS